MCAERQSRGRGRHGRQWTSETGNLYASGLFPLPKNPLAGAQLGFAAALSISETLRTYIPDADIRLKWPNDVLIGGAKVSGILLETGSFKGRNWVVVGIGLNLTSHPEDTTYPATHLVAHIKKKNLSGPEPLYTGPEAVLALLASHFEHWRLRLVAEGFAPLRKAWRKQAHGLGETAQIVLGDRRLKARILGLGENGELQIKHDDGTLESIYAGDVYPHFQNSLGA